jgi:glycosyltransferase involved in cell wall biosynthesis
VRILLIGPCADGGSIPPYLDVLADALRHQGVRVDRLGSDRLPIDPATGRFWSADRIVKAATTLLDGVDLMAYDVLSVHFGNLEIEQLIPALWARRRRPPAVYHVHSLDWTLFTTHVPEPSLRAAVDDGVARMDAFVYFGTYGRDQFIRRVNPDSPSTVAWLPTTIPAGTRPHRGPSRLAAALRPDSRPVGTLYGYAAPWKDAAGLLDACQRATNACRIVLAGPFWDDPAEAGTDLTREAASPVGHGQVEVNVVAQYLPAGDRRALVANSTFAVFPYRPHPTFQGSGAIADYLAHGIPVVGTDVANMRELIGPAGIVVPANDPDAFASALDRMTGDPRQRQELVRQAATRSDRFNAAHHAARCLELYHAATTPSLPGRAARS